jgi:hypothetical protein
LRLLESLRKAMTRVPGQVKALRPGIDHGAERC